jgi:hypothetical protein
MKKGRYGLRRYTHDALRASLKVSLFKPAHISFFIFDRCPEKRCTCTREAYLNVTSNFFLFILTTGGVTAITRFNDCVLKLDDIYMQFSF